MLTIKPFKALRPEGNHAADIAALPYDVYNRQEAREVVSGRPLSFLNIDRPETLFPPEHDMYAPEVYAAGRKRLEQMIRDGFFIQDQSPCFYIYELTMNGRTQTGLVACSAVDDYLDGRIKKHENTRQEKEEDRVRHVDTLGVQSGPIFLAYREQTDITELLKAHKQNQPPVYDFTADDGITHRVWVIDDGAGIQLLSAAFAGIDSSYIADGHHRAASAVRVSQLRRKQHPDYTGEEDYNYFLSVLFADSELKILDYNRVLKTRNGHTDDELLQLISTSCEISMPQKEPVRPQHKGEFALLLGSGWYLLKARPDHRQSGAVESLDVAFLQREVLAPVFGITDAQTSSDIDFVGGIRGLDELVRRVQSDCTCAFAMYPTSISELFGVADAGLLMPPKSTWFEPKLRSGLFLHQID